MSSQTPQLSGNLQPLCSLYWWHVSPCSHPITPTSCRTLSRPPTKTILHSNAHFMAIRGHYLGQDCSSLPWQITQKVSPPHILFPSPHSRWPQSRISNDIGLNNRVASLSLDLTANLLLIKKKISRLHCQSTPWLDENVLRLYGVGCDIPATVD